MQAYTGWLTPAEASALKDEAKKAREDAARKAAMLASLRKGKAAPRPALPVCPPARGGAAAGSALRLLAARQSTSRPCPRGYFG